MFKRLTSEIKEVPSIFNQKYIPTLDGLRAVAVVIVLIAHVDHRVYKSNWVETYIPTGFLGVSIFFVLSGFLITTLLLKEKVTTGDISLKEFYKRRFFRIIPVAYLYLLIILALKYIFSLPVTLPQILLCFLFFRSLDGTFNQLYTSHYWSLSYEEQYYLMYPILLKKSLKLFVGVLLFVIIAQILYLTPFVYKHIHIPGKKIFYQLVLRSFDGLCVGSLFAVMVYQKIIDPSKKIKYHNLLNIILVVLIVFFSATAFTYPLGIISSIAIGLFITLNINSEHKTVAYKILNSRPFIYIGKLSYSIYIWQQIFTIALPWEKSFAYSDSVILNLIALSLVAYCSYNFYEKFFLKFRYKKDERQKGLN